MRYQIEGDSKATGKPVTVIVDADSTLGARQQAADMGIDIVTLNVVSDHVAIEPGNPLPIRPALSQRPMWVIVLIIVLVGFLGLAILSAGSWLVVASEDPSTQVIVGPAVQPAVPESSGPEVEFTPEALEPLDPHPIETTVDPAP